MKKINLLLLIPILVSLSGCQTKTEKISFEEYVEIVNQQQEGDKDIFIFTSSSCSHCQRIKPLIDNYITTNPESDFTIYELSVDYSRTLSNKYVYDDKSMGLLTGDSTNDCLKALDNRIVKFVDQTNTQLVSMAGFGNYMYVCTPLMIWYESGIEVRVENAVESKLEKNEHGNIMLESFVEFLQFPETKPDWSEKFDLKPYK